MMLASLSTLSQTARGALRQFTGRRGAAPAGPAGFSPALLAQIGRPLCEDTRERAECAALLDQGRDLARQEAWDRLGAAINLADANRTATAAGTPAAELLAMGARSDLSRALDGASAAGALSTGSRMFAGLAAMEDVARDFPDDPACAAVVALSHMDAGWAWYKQGWRRGRPEQHVAAFRTAFARAEAVLAPFAAGAGTSALLASTRCALLAGQPQAEQHVVARYETLIRLAPAVPGHLRAFGLHLLPCWFGSYAALELAARRMAAQTAATWGAGGYAWVYFDALLQDPGAFATLDSGYFLEAVSDILARHPGQHMVNLFAACLSQLLDRDSGPDRAQRRLLDRLRNQLIRGEMTETHGWVWALTDSGYATPGSGPAGGPARAETGAQNAWAALSTVLAREVRRNPGQPSPAP